MLLSSQKYEYNIKPYIITNKNTIIEVSDSFLEFTGFSPSDLLNQSLLFAWNELFRIHSNPLIKDTHYEEFLFTKTLDVRFVLIHKYIVNDGNEIIIEFDEKPNSRLEHIFPHACQLLSENVIGVSIYSAPDFILLRANQIYLEFCDSEYNTPESTFGRQIYDFIREYKNSTAETEILKTLITGKSAYFKEFPYIGFVRGMTYWDQIITPIKMDDRFKFIVTITQEVTERVINRKQLEEKNNETREQKEQLESIIENIYDGVFVSDKEGHLLLMNAEGRKQLFEPDSISAFGEAYKTSRYYDMEGNEISLNDMPAKRGLNGESIKNRRLLVKRPDKEIIIDVNAAPLYNQSGELVNVIACCRDVTELIKQQDEINIKQMQILASEKEKSEALESSIKLKDEFLYLISHEMRTPSSIINIALQAIESLYTDEVTSNIGKHLKIIKQNTNRQLRLINNLLDITRIHSGNIKLNKSIFDIVYLTKLIISSVELYANQKRITVNFTSNISKLNVYLDDEKYERIILNLLANSLKFTPKDKSININITKQKQAVYITVQDEGIGIPREKQQVIFERFGQADTSLSRQAEGTGLGLHLVKLYVNTLEGDINLESDEGNGCTFTIMLPIIKPNKIDKVLISNGDTGKLDYCNDRIIQSASIEFSDIYFDNL